MFQRNLLNKGLQIFALLLTFWVKGYSQSISLEDKHLLVRNYKESLQDTINKHIEIDRPFVVGGCRRTMAIMFITYFYDHRPVAGTLIFKTRSMKPMPFCTTSLMTNSYTDITPTTLILITLPSMRILYLSLQSITQYSGTSGP